MKMMRSCLAQIALVGSSLFLTGTAMATATDYTGLVNVLRVDADGRGIIYFDVSSTPGASCRVAGMTAALAFNAQTPGGDAMMRTVMAAQLAGRKLRFVGKDACTLYKDPANPTVGIVEDAAAVYLMP